MKSPWGGPYPINKAWLPERAVIHPHRHVDYVPKRRHVWSTWSSISSKLSRNLGVDYTTLMTTYGWIIDRFRSNDAVMPPFCDLHCAGWSRHECDKCRLYAPYRQSFDPKICTRSTLSKSCAGREKHRHPATFLQCAQPNNALMKPLYTLGLLQIMI